MRILYSSDLHGDSGKHSKLFQLACKEQVDMVLMGGDLLGSFHKHGRSIHEYQACCLGSTLIPLFEQYESEEIHWAGILGNDDLLSVTEAFASICSRFSKVHDLNLARLQLGGLEFLGYPNVVDYPFPPKERTRREDDAFEMEPQPAKSFRSRTDGWEIINNWAEEITLLPSIEEELQNLPAVHNWDRAICVFHQPPRGLGLDRLSGGKTIGSEAITRFIASRQPLLSVHGHAHESPQESGIWHARLGKTICVQPGQFDDHRLVYCLIDTESMAMGRFQLD